MFYNSSRILCNGLAVFNLAIWGVVFWKISAL